MQIRRPRGITKAQFMVVTAVGFLAGVYVWKPIFEKYNKAQKEEVSITNSVADVQQKTKEPTSATTTASC